MSILMPMSICRWYIRDDNAIPPVYILQPISTQFPDLLSSDQARVYKAKEAWWKVVDQLKAMLITGAKKHLQDTNRVHTYLMSGKHL